MDCVTCLLMGMCVLCRRDFGGSSVQNITITGAASPGRPMTREEVDSAVQATLRHLGSVDSSSNSYRRESKLDPRFAHMGIGKRLGPQMDLRFSHMGIGKRFGPQLDLRFAHMGIGKRYGPEVEPYIFAFDGGNRQIQDNTEILEELIPRTHDPPQQIDSSLNFDQSNTPMLPEEIENFSTTVELENLPNFYVNKNPFFSKNQLERSRMHEFLENETQKLRFRRQEHRTGSLSEVSDTRR